MEDLHDVTAFHTRGQRNTSIKYRNITYNFLIFNRTCYIVLLQMDIVSAISLYSQ